MDRTGAYDRGGLRIVGRRHVRHVLFVSTPDFAPPIPEPLPTQSELSPTGREPAASISSADWATSLYGEAPLEAVDVVSENTGSDCVALPQPSISDLIIDVDEPVIMEPVILEPESTEADEPLLMAPDLPADVDVDLMTRVSSELLRSSSPDAVGNLMDLILASSDLEPVQPELIDDLDLWETPSQDDDE